MKYKTKPQKPVIVEANQAPFTGFLGDGKTPVEKGQWVIDWPNGKTKVIPPSEFAEKFSVVRKRNKPKVDTRES